ncbi:hypothetical protein C5167_048269 [Papaver somniferum]|uniref:LysM domain-containing protein n=1 Tax=Papaver somniferum TaxID=3469 RepID=A0A4Y7KLF9_PAPSO|nr:uncharacterized protein LOC113305095 [Papaver somniferum]RZC72789.1 hypothetical protein C5167_048269 [Papaver somniferum]
MSNTIVRIADEVSWWCALLLVSLILLTTFKQITSSTMASPTDMVMMGRSYEDTHNHNNQFLMGGYHKPCDEIYVVGEGETLHTISDKCGDPYIVEQNPHIHDPDDVFPGLVIKITPYAVIHHQTIL